MLLLKIMKNKKSNILLLFNFLNKRWWISLFENIFVKYLYDKNNYKILNLNNKQIWLLWKLKHFKKYIKAHNIKHVFYQFHTFPLFLYKITYWIKIHDLYFCQFRYWKEFIITILNSIFAKYIIVPSYATKRRLKRLFTTLYLKRLNSKIKVIYNCYDENYLTQLTKSTFEVVKYFWIEKNKYILYMWWYEDWNIDIIKCIQQNKKYENFKILIPWKIQNKLKEIYTKQWVQCLWFVSDEELISLYKYAYVILYFNDNEWFWYIPLESLFAWTPIITNWKWSIKEILWDSWMYYNKSDISNALIYLSKNYYKIKNLINKECTVKKQLFNTKRILNTYFTFLSKQHNENNWKDC